MVTAERETELALLYKFLIIYKQLAGALPVEVPFQLPGWFSVLYIRQSCVSSFTYFTLLPTVGDSSAPIGFRSLIQYRKHNALASFSQEAYTWEVENIITTWKKITEQKKSEPEKNRSSLFRLKQWGATSPGGKSHREQCQVLGWPECVVSQYSEEPSVLWGQGVRSMGAGG